MYIVSFTWTIIYFKSSITFNAWALAVSSLPWTANTFTSPFHTGRSHVPPVLPWEETQSVSLSSNLLCLAKHVHTLNNVSLVYFIFFKLKVYGHSYGPELFLFSCWLCETVIAPPVLTPPPTSFSATWTIVVGLFLHLWRTCWFHQRYS